MGKGNNSGVSDGAYRVVTVDTGHRTYSGPYGTLKAAENKIASEENKWFAGFPKHIEMWVEATPKGWERV